MRGKKVIISKGTFIRFIKGEEKAIEAVYLSFKNLMFFVISSYISSKYDAEDVLSEAFIKAIEHRHELKDYRKLKSYLATIAKNQALDFLRKQKEVPSSDVLDEIYGEEDKTNELLSAFEPLLTNKETIVAYLKIGFSYTWNEIVEETGISESTARRLYESAKEKLRKELK